MKKLSLSDEIRTTTAMFNGFPPSQENEYAKGSVIIFWESHTKNSEDRENIRATSNLLHRTELSQYEKYEIRTGYLSRFNYMPKDIDQMSAKEIEEAIKKGYEEQDVWLKRCEPDLPSFTPKNWKDCISEKDNPSYNGCKKLMVWELDNNKSFHNAFLESVNLYADRNGTSRKNGEEYILEEISWIYSLPLMYFGKYIYLIHVGKDNPVVRQMFSTFSNFNKAVKWLSPRFKEFSFKNDEDFLMYYNVNINVGCSYAMDMKALSLTKMDQNADLKENSLHLEFENAGSWMFQYIIEKLPAHIYWLNRENVYLGCNKVQAKDLKLKSTKEIFGKTNLDFHDKDTAKKLNNINELVMSSGKPFEGEEPVGYIGGHFASCLSSKIPIYNIHGKCIGLLGVSFDITEKKKIEELSNKLKLQEELYNVAKWVAHDIAQPVTVLKGYLELNTSLQETERRIFNEAAQRIEGIVDRLLIKYRGGKDLEETNYVFVRWCLHHVLNQGVSKYRKQGIEFKSDFDKLNKFVFIEGNFVDFSRMISNLINNAMEAIEGDKKGIISIETRVKDEKVEIRIKDNGKGMPKEVIERILSEEKVETTKERGHGLGLEQVRETVKELKGKMEIKAKEGEGTEFILKFKKAQTPKWFVDKIVVRKGDTLVILDDEVLMHKIWKEKLKKVQGADTINTKYFTKGVEALKFLKSMKDKGRVFLFADYSLRRQDIDGINVIDKSRMKERHILVTNMYLSEIKDFNEKSDYIKMFPKTLLNDFSLSVD
jgi:nitrogen-specific signal transduction histidine kinase